MLDVCCIWIMSRSLPGRPLSINPSGMFIRADTGCKQIDNQAVLLSIVLTPDTPTA